MEKEEYTFTIILSFVLSFLLEYLLIYSFISLVLFYYLFGHLFINIINTIITHARACTCIYIYWKCIKDKKKIYRNILIYYYVIFPIQSLVRIVHCPNIISSILWISWMLLKRQFSSCSSTHIYYMIYNHIRARENKWNTQSMQ